MVAVDVNVNVEKVRGMGRELKERYERVKEEARKVRAEGVAHVRKV